MATQTAGSSDFIKNLGKMYGTYTGSFIGFIILLAILEQVGVPNKILGYLFVGFTITGCGATAASTNRRRTEMSTVSAARSFSAAAALSLSRSGATSVQTRRTDSLVARS